MAAVGNEAPSEKGDANHRRSLLLSLGGWIIMGTPKVAFAESDDPFAQMDAIAEKIQSSSNFPNSPPLPTSKQTEQELVPDEKQAESKKAAATSDLDSLLKETKKRKQIDPRTHG